MRLVTARHHGTTSAARVDDDEFVLLPYADVGALLDDPDWRVRGDVDGERLPATTDLAPVVPNPRKILCVGLNFPAHGAEVGREPPAHPSLFAKFARALIGPHDPIELPPAEISTSVDWEIELAAVIGTTVRYATAHTALAAIAGYTVINDVSVRDWQLRTSQATAGKTFERTTPLGPALVTGDEIDHARNLRMRCMVNGQVVQSASTVEMIFSAAEVVAYASAVITLDPGDVIALGSPSGVGAARTPPIFLAAGDAVTSAIDGIGELVNACRLGPAAPQGSRWPGWRQQG